MINLLGWSMRDYLTFSDTELNLSQDRGLYVVSGKNLDSLKQGNANAVGKSRLLSCIPTVLYESDPLAVKNQKSKKDVLKSKSSETSVTLRSHSGETWRVRQTPTKYFIDKQLPNGEFEDQKAIKLEVARKRIASMFPITESTFYATSYIQSQRECKFQRAKPADRLAFITDIFNLEVYDKLRKYFASKLSELAKVEVEYKTYAQQLLELETKLKDVSWSKKDSSLLDELRSSISSLRDDLKVMYEEAGSLQSLQENAERLRKLKSNLKKLKASLPELPTKETIRTLKSAIRDFDKYETYVDQLSDYKKQSAKLKTALDDLPKIPKDLTLTKVSKEFDRCQDELSELKSKLAVIEDHNSKVEEQIEAQRIQEKRLADILKKLKATSLYSYVEGKKENTWLTKVQPIVNLAQLTLDLASQLDDHTHSDSCPLCGSDSFDTKSVIKRIKQSKVILADFVFFDHYFRLREHTNEASVIEKRPTKKLRKRIDDLKSELNQLRKHGAALEDKEQLESKLADLAKPKKVKAPSSSLEELESTLEASEQYLSIVERIKDLGDTDIKPVAGKLDKLRSKISKRKKTLDKMESDERKLSLRKMEVKSLRERIRDLSDKVEAIGPVLAERKLYETLKAAYSPNCLKLQAADKIVNRLEESLNRYSSLVYLEPMRFEIRTDKSGITAIAIRNNGERSDISQLSGAETNCFRLLFALSLLPLLPENKRTNFLVLDEPDSACSPVVRSHLIREFLPKLCEVVPHVFWLTPSSIDEFQSHITINVIKENGTSHVDIISED